MRTVVSYAMAGATVLLVAIFSFTFFHWKLFFWGAGSVPFQSVLHDRFVLIAHGLGGIDGKSILNAREAFEGSYQRGKRVFETDLMFTEDGVLVAFHEGIENWFGWDKKIGEMKAEEFLGKKLFGKYSTMTFDDLLSLMEKYPDVWLVIDTKDDFSRSMSGIVRVVDAHNPDLLRRIVPQVYREEDIKFLRTDYPQIREAILTLYRVDYKDERVLQLATMYPEIVAVSMSLERFSERLVTGLKEKGTTALVHTVNDEKEIERYARLGVGGVFTDK